MQLAVRLMHMKLYISKASIANAICIRNVVCNFTVCTTCYQHSNSFILARNSRFISESIRDKIYFKSFLNHVSVTHIVRSDHNSSHKNTQMSDHREGS